MKSLIKNIFITILILLSFFLVFYCITGTIFINSILEQITARNTFDLTGVINDELLKIFIEQQNNLAQLHRDYLEIAVTIVLGAGAVFYFFNIRPFEKKMENFEKRMIRQEETIKVSKDNIIKEINQQLDKSLFEINLEQLWAQSETSRLFAINANRDQLYNKAFVWWLTSADYLYKADPNSEHIIKNIKFAKEGLENILKLKKEHKKLEVELLRKSLPEFEIKRILDTLAGKYPEEVGKIKKILGESLKIIV